MMIHQRAGRIASGLVKRKVIDEKQHEVYTYGFELIVSALINILLMAIISIAFRRYYDWLLFLAAFVPLRMTAGGYHAGSHMKCIIVGTVGFTALLALCRFWGDWIIAILLIAALSFLLILSFSPVEAHNKKLKGGQRKKNRTISMCIGVANLVIAVVVRFIPSLSGVLNIYYAGVFAAALSMLAVKTTKLGEGVLT